MDAGHELEDPGDDQVGAEQDRDREQAEPGVDEGDDARGDAEDAEQHPQPPRAAAGSSNSSIGERVAVAADMEICPG